MEIVQIGAVKLLQTDNGPLMTDTFHTYVWPQNGRLPNHETLQFLQIAPEDFVQPMYFQEMIEAFQSWMGEGKSFLCTWGIDDRARIVEHCKTYKLDLAWFRNYNDIQLMYTRLNGKDRGSRFGLTKALCEAGIPFLGHPHHALDDAFNTAKLFRTVYPQLVLQESEYVEEPLVVSEVVYQTEQEPNLAFAKYGDQLKKMFAS
jgi:inhibitor of KinA sporulation pathway (predicted exonuclease)